MLKIRNLDYIIGRKIPTTELTMISVSDISHWNIYSLQFKDADGSDTLGGEIRIDRNPVLMHYTDALTGNIVLAKEYKVTLWFDSYTYTNTQLFRASAFRNMSALLMEIYSRFNTELKYIIKVDGK